MTANKILLSPEAPDYRTEALAGAAGILPGHLIEMSGEDFIVNNSVDAVNPDMLFADISVGDAGDITRAYVDNETVNGFAAPKGARVLARFAGGITLAKGAAVASAGDGTLKAGATTAIIGYVQEVVTAGAGAESGAGFGVIRVA